MKRVFLAVLMVMSLSALGFRPHTTEPTRYRQDSLSFMNHDSSPSLQKSDSSIFVLWKPVSWREMFKRWF
ncbi:hypothetical protein PVA44_03245 [Entomospira nematocerorum]|uniref:Uncharacterized protein n=1 Tax=Entomospira nematocerorum TaxID=2719987 RepID=A0A968KT07_9SPIO|nr:hypothetical protein [Entomospira nematocera]NIZ46951.1 hypothetical protein [Entomospira nematocera]WDI34503.1 hypothetical protein PVA44_03245 [Entomospira nematocera]